jgi:hypothetical protein
VSLDIHDFLHGAGLRQHIDVFCRPLRSHCIRPDICGELVSNDYPGETDGIRKHLGSNEPDGLLRRRSDNRQKFAGPVQQQDCDLVITSETHSLDRDDAAPSCHHDSMRLHSARLIDNLMVAVAHNERASLHTKGRVVMDGCENAGLYGQKSGPIGVGRHVAKGVVNLRGNTFVIRLGGAVLRPVKNGIE